MDLAITPSAEATCLEASDIWAECGTVAAAAALHPDDPKCRHTQSSCEVSLRTGAWNQPDCSSGSSQSRRHQFKALPRAPLCCPSLEEGTPQTHGLWVALQLCHLGDPTTSSPHHCNVATIALGKNLQLPSHYTPSIRASGVSRPKPVLTEKNLRKDPETQRWRTGCRHLQEWQEDMGTLEI